MYGLSLGKTKVGGSNPWFGVVGKTNLFLKRLTVEPAGYHTVKLENAPTALQLTRRLATLTSHLQELGPRFAPRISVRRGPVLRTAVPSTTVTRDLNRESLRYIQETLHTWLKVIVPDCTMNSRDRQCFFLVIN